MFKNNFEPTSENKAYMGGLTLAIRKTWSNRLPYTSQNDRKESLMQGMPTSKLYGKSILVLKKYSYVPFDPNDSSTSEKLQDHLQEFFHKVNIVDSDNFYEDETLKIPLYKWYNRRWFFSRYDEGIMLSSEGFSLVTAEPIAKHISKSIYELTKFEKIEVMEKERFKKTAKYFMYRVILYDSSMHDLTSDIPGTSEVAPPPVFNIGPSDSAFLNYNSRDCETSNENASRTPASSNTDMNFSVLLKGSVRWQALNEITTNVMGSNEVASDVTSPNVVTSDAKYPDFAALNATCPDFAAPDAMSSDGISLNPVGLYGIAPGKTALAGTQLDQERRNKAVKSLREVGERPIDKISLEQLIYDEFELQLIKRIATKELHGTTGNDMENNHLELDPKGHTVKEEEAVEDTISNNQRLDCIIIDVCSGFGGNSIQFSKYFCHVLGIEKDEDRFVMGINNARVYNCSNILFYNKDFLQLLKKDTMMFADWIFISPPWGGSSYKTKASFYISAEFESIIEMMQQAARISRHACLYLPASQDTLELLDFAIDVFPCAAIILDYISTSVSRKPKYLVVYFIQDTLIDCISPGVYQAVAQLIAEELDEREDKILYILSIIEKIGIKTTLDILQATIRKFDTEGMMRINEDAKRTKGGIFFHIVKSRFPKEMKLLDSKRKCRKNKFCRKFF